MTYKNEVRFCRRYGGAMLAVSCITGAVFWTTGLWPLGVAVKPTSWYSYVFTLWTFWTLAGMVLFVFGGLVRPMQKAIYHNLLESNEYYRSRTPANPLLQLWLSLDWNGRDRNE